MAKKDSECAVCGCEYERKYEYGFFTQCPKCGDEPLKDMQADRYRLALFRLISIVSTDPLRHWNCDVIGNKGNACSWGLCNETAALWPDAEDHMWPYSFRKHGRIAPLPRLDGQLCPLDKSMEEATTPVQLEKMDPQGCFYRCLAFSDNPKKLTRETVIANIHRLLTVYPEEGFPEVAKRTAERRLNAQKWCQERRQKETERRKKQEKHQGFWQRLSVGR